jgi:hypothetical protein
MIAFFVVVIMLLAPSVASAQGPGGTDEYVEQLPGAGGNEPSEQSAGDPETDEPLTPAQQGAVEEQGADGSAAVELAQATGPDGGGDSAGDSADGGSGGGNQAGSEARSGLPGVVGNVAGESDDSGTGILLPLVIGGTLVAALALVIVRRRRHAAS